MKWNFNDYVPLVEEWTDTSRTEGCGFKFRLRWQFCFRVKFKNSSLFHGKDLFFLFFALKQFHLWVSLQKNLFFSMGTVVDFFPQIQWGNLSSLPPNPTALLWRLQGKLPFERWMQVAQWFLKHTQTNENSFKATYKENMLQ